MTSLSQKKNKPKYMTLVSNPAKIIHPTLKKVYRQEEQIEKMLKFLMAVYLQSSAAYAPVKIIDQAKQFKVSPHISGVLLKYSILKKIGNRNNSRYHWPGGAPDEELAERLTQNLKSYLSEYQGRIRREQIERGKLKGLIPITHKPLTLKTMQPTKERKRTEITPEQIANTLNYMNHVYNHINTTEPIVFNMTDANNQFKMYKAAGAVMRELKYIEKYTEGRPDGLRGAIFKYKWIGPLPTEDAAKEIIALLRKRVAEQSKNKEVETTPPVTNISQNANPKPSAEIPLTKPKAEPSELKIDIALSLYKLGRLKESAKILKEVEGNG